MLSSCPVAAAAAAADSWRSWPRPLQEQILSPPHGESLCPALWTPAKGHIYIFVKIKRTVCNLVKRSVLSQACLALVCATVDVPGQGNGHVAPPDGVSAQDNGPADGVPSI